MSPEEHARPPGGCQDWCSCRSVAVEVGFEPTEDLRLHTLSSTAHHRSLASASVRTSADVGPADAGEWPRTGVSETKTEPTGDPDPAGPQRSLASRGSRCPRCLETSQ